VRAPRDLVPAATFALLLAVGPSACDDPAAPCTPFDYSRYQPRSQPSFRRDIQPTLAISCALSTTCHGTDRGAAPQNLPLLGPNRSVIPDDTMVGAILSDLLRPSEKAPALPRVSPGRPQDSFLLHKLDGTHACATPTCPTGCGARMPLLGQPLPGEKIDQIRDWILQGAPNN
jgi:hypothetical protein